MTFESNAQCYMMAGIRLPVNANTGGLFIKKYSKAGITSFPKLQKNFTLY